MPSRRLASARVLLCLSALFIPAAGLAATYYVDNQSPAASDAGPGTLETPYRTISAAVTQRGGPGTTILVMPGTYPEQVTVGASGTSISRFVIEAQGAVTVDGADDFSNLNLWVPVSGSTFLAASVTWLPVQVLADGGRLTSTSSEPSAMSPMTFRYVAGTGLYVNAGGGNPGAHGTRVGRRAYGFRLSGRSWVTVRGFRVSAAETKGVYVSSASDGFTIENSVVEQSGGQGVHLSGSSGGLIAGNEVSYSGDHGIYLSSAVTGSTVRGNFSHHNARPLVRAANGIQLNGSSGNRIENNRLGDNQDTGLQINTGSNNNVCVQNVSWNNGDHGYDHLSSSGNVHAGDVAYANYKDGFSFEGNAPGGKLYNCIAANNGIGTAEFNLWVDAQSSVGFASDYNLFWNSNGQSPIKYGSTVYSAVSAFSAATGQDAHSTQADPRFVSPGTGNFHLGSGSPAIDAASSDAPGWAATDAEGAARFDDPATANTGAGAVPYADRGAHEFGGGGGVIVDQGPAVSAPAGAIVGEGSLLTINVTAIDPNGDPITTLVAGLSGLPAGHNAQFVPGLGNASGTLTWTPAFTHAGVYTVTFTASNALSGSATTTITVTNTDRPPVVSAPGTVRVTQGAAATFNVSAADPDGDAITSLTANWSTLPAGNNATFTLNTSSSGTFRWTTQIGQTGSYTVSFTATNALSGKANTRISVRRTGLGTASEAEGGAPLVLALSAPVPNPSAARVTFELSLPAAERVSWSVYDLQGRELWSEASEFSAGRHVLEWRGADRRAGRAGAGLYFVRVRVGGTEFMRRFVRI